MMKAPATAPKSVRYSADELARLGRLRRFYPEADNEADMIRFATQRGLVLMEAEVAAVGGGMPKGMTEDDLASIILPRILAALTWLSRLGRLPFLVSGSGMQSNTVTSDSIGLQTPDHEPLDELDLSAADDIGGLGGDFLGDWPE